jgi:hypothetical protein
VRELARCWRCKLLVYYYICVLILVANSTKALVARREVEEARAALEADRYD